MAQVSKSFLSYILSVLWHRKFLVISVMLLSMTVFLYSSTIQPRYTAQSLIFIKSHAPDHRTIMLSEAEVLRSRSLAKHVITKLDLMNDPEFNPKLQVSSEPKSISLFKVKDDLHQGSEEKTASFKALSIYHPDTDKSLKNLSASDEARVIDYLIDNIRAEPVPESLVMRVQFTSVDARKSALVVNTLLDTYIEKNDSTNQPASKESSAWLKRLNQQLHQSQEKMRQIEETKRILQETAVVASPHLSELNTQLAQAKAQRAKSAAILEQIKGGMHKPQAIEMTEEAYTSPVLQNLKIKETDIRKKLSELSLRYGDKHPAMIDAKEERKEIGKQIHEELTSIARLLEARLKIADTHIQTIEQSLMEAGTQPPTMKADYNDVGNIEDPPVKPIDRYQPVKSDKIFQNEKARVLSYAAIPRDASYPDKSLWLGITALVSFLVGLMLALCRERLDKGYKTAVNIEQETGYVCLGLIPFAKGMSKRAPVADFIFDKKGRVVAESVRTLRTVLNLQSQDPTKRPKVLTVTSSLPDEGKTTLSAWMARLAAKSNEKVVIIDCDLRRPRLHTTFGKNPENTLVEYLTGRATFEDILQKDESGAHVIYARAVPNNALDLLAKDRMRNLINSLRERYDLVILDTPPNIAVSDARLLATQSDRTLYAVAWNKTSREVVNAGIKNFADIGYDDLSFVLTNVDIKRHSRYGFGDAISYYNQYRQYYADP